MAADLERIRERVRGQWSIGAIRRHVGHRTRRDRKELQCLFDEVIKWNIQHGIDSLTFFADINSPEPSGPLDLDQ